MTIWESFAKILSDLGGLLLTILSFFVSPLVVMMVLGGLVLVCLASGLYDVTSEYEKNHRRRGWLALLAIIPLVIVVAAVVQYIGVNGIQPHSWEWTK